VIDAGASFAPGQVYVSLSRLTGLQGLVLHSKISPSCISTDERVIEFAKNEIDEEALENTLKTEQRAYVRLLLCKAFLGRR
jgi:hypothetical protein